MATHREGIAKGVKHNNRKPFVYQHRLLKYLDALGRLCEGKATVDYVAMRGKKFKEVRDWQ